VTTPRHSLSTEPLAALRLPRALRSRSARGDAAAFAAVYQRHHQEIYRYCRAILRDDEDAQDALQTTMAKAFAALQHESRDFELRPWLFRIAHNEAISMLRRRRDATSLDAAPEPAVDSLPGTLADRERLAELRADLADLPERQRSALVLRELSGLGHDEIAQVLSSSARAVKQAIFEARTALAECAEGRDMACETVQRALSDGDGRVLRGRRIRAHLRSCRSCRRFRTAIETRPADLRALAAPLPAGAGAAVLAAVLPGGSATVAGGGAAAAGGALAAGASGTGAAGTGAGVAAGAGAGGAVAATGSAVAGGTFAGLATKAAIVAAVGAAALGAARLEAPEGGPAGAAGRPPARSAAAPAASAGARSAPVRRAAGASATAAATAAAADPIAHGAARGRSHRPQATRAPEAPHRRTNGTPPGRHRATARRPAARRAAPARAAHPPRAARRAHPPRTAPPARRAHPRSITVAPRGPAASRPATAVPRPRPAAPKARAPRAGTAGPAHRAAAPSAATPAPVPAPSARGASSSAPGHAK
jgi:RNA polymerase sigma factor (sigma-70 family)